MTIFILIAGTYTPICVLALNGGWRAGLLGLIRTLALCGVVLKLLWMDVTRWLSVGIYLAMGWLAVIAASAIFRAIPPGGTGAWSLEISRACVADLVYTARPIWPDVRIHTLEY